MGCNGKYREEYPDVVASLRKQGHTKLEVAERLGVNQDTIYEWAKKYPEFSDALKCNKEIDLAESRNSLHRVANGYEYEEVETTITIDKKGIEHKRVKRIRRHIPPNVLALQVELYNRDQDHFKRVPGGSDSNKGAIAAFMESLKVERKNGTA